jgi:hypothetical protein
MGQLLLGLFAVASVFAGFWAVGRMAPKTAIPPEEALRAELALLAKDPPPLPSSYILSTVAGSVGTAMVFGMGLALHRWPDALVYAFYLTALVALLVFQLRAIEHRSYENLRRLGHQGLYGLWLTIYGLGVMGPHSPLDHDRVSLALPLIWAMTLAGRLWSESRRRPAQA